jgi:hypothetical protein
LFGPGPKKSTSGVCIPSRTRKLRLSVLAK